MPQWFKRIAIAVRSAPPAQRPTIANEVQIAATVCRAASVGAAGAPLIAGPLLVEKGVRPAATVQVPGDPQLLARHLTALHLPNFLSEHDRLAQRGGGVAFDHRSYLLHLAAQEAAARDRRRIARLIRVAGFPPVQGLDAIDLADATSGTQARVRDLSGGGFVERRENVVMVGGGGSGKTRLAIGLGFAACGRGRSVRYTTAAALVAELNAAFEARRLLRLHRQLDCIELLIIDDLGRVPLSPQSAALLFEVFSRRAERRSTLVASLVPPEAWDRIFGIARLADAVVERLARHAHRLNLGAASELAAWLPDRPADGSVWREEPLGDRGTAARAIGRAPAAVRAEVLCG